MSWNKGMIRWFGSEETGQGLVEYAMIIMLIAVAATAALGRIASPVTNIFNKAETDLRR